ncbi:Uncharacterized protein HZ326_13941 [Fusarium oxysporum f. sp. albedinis]|nr:Uncharacterized protein HZ326_13941 [Fusarium oxysporum f. sp. albedinis]
MDFFRIHAWSKKRNVSTKEAHHADWHQIWDSSPEVSQRDARIESGDVPRLFDTCNQQHMVPSSHNLMDCCSKLKHLMIVLRVVCQWLNACMKLIDNEKARLAPCCHPEDIVFCHFFHNDI